MELLVDKNLFPPSYPKCLDNAIGITTTVPIEVIFAAGYFPIDLNNIFITDSDPYDMVDFAELQGLPRNTCAWTKGIYAAAQKIEMKRVVGVVQGDCSHTAALMDVFISEGIEVIPFEYPHKRDANRLMRRIKKFSDEIGADDDKIVEMKTKLDHVRDIVEKIDMLTWQENKVTGMENHIWTVSTSDMAGDYLMFEEQAKKFLDYAKKRQPMQHDIRIGYIGVPPICDDLYTFLEDHNCHVVFNEVQRQFSMPYETRTLAEQYTLYTFPYDIFVKIDDIKKEIERRKIDGLIFYVQNFCHRPIYEKIIRKYINIPIITLDFDKPGKLNGSIKTRVEAFTEMLKK